MHKLILAGVMLMCLDGRGQQTNARGSRPAVQTPDSDRLSLQSALKAEPDVRGAALRNLVATANEEVATDAMIALVRSHSPDVLTPFLELLPRLSDSKLSDIRIANILGALESSSREIHLREAFARGALRRIIQDPPPERPNADGAGAAGMAAVLLTSSVDPADRILTGKVLRMRPHEALLWLAKAKSGMMSEDEVALARSVLTDKGTPGRTRVAAAAALAPGDPTAAAFVTENVEAFLSRYGGVDAGLIIGKAMGQPMESHDSNYAAEFLSGLRIIGTLEFLQTLEAERITFAYVGCANQFISRALGLLAAMRWPQHYLDLHPLYGAEGTKLIAALSVFHPELLKTVQTLMSSEELDKLRSKLIDDGIWSVFSLPGGAGLVF